jgi:hypothetical protein
LHSENYKVQKIFTRWGFLFNNTNFRLLQNIFTCSCSSKTSNNKQTYLLKPQWYIFHVVKQHSQILSKNHIFTKWKFLIYNTSYLVVYD